jgi:hypothetical protein
MSERDLHDRVSELEPAALRAQLDTIFHARGEAGFHARGEAGVHAGDDVPLRLVGVIEGQPDRRVQRFSILLHGPADRMLSQGTYSFRHDTLGEFLLFIVPVVGSNDERIVYEACFSRRVEEPSAP